MYKNKKNIPWDILFVLIEQYVCVRVGYWARQNIHAAEPNTSCSR